METLKSKFLWLPLPDALAISSRDPRIHGGRINFSELDGKATVVQPGGTMTGPEYHHLQASNGETFHFSMPNVLHIDALNSRIKQSQEDQYVDTEMGEDFEFDSIPDSKLFPWPEKGLTIIPEDSSVVDNRKALFLWLQLNQPSLMELRRNQDEQVTSLESDLCIHVFLNGSICSSRLISSDVLNNAESSFYDGFFHGIKIRGCMEKAWIIGDNSEAAYRNERKDVPLELRSAARWKAINQKLFESVFSDSDVSAANPHLSTYISAIAGLPVPLQDLPESDTTFAVIDVILVHGSAQKYSTEEQDWDQEQQFSSPETATKVLRSLVYSSGSEMSITKEADVDESDEEMHDSEIRAPDHISNLTTLQANQGRSARSIAQFVKRKRRRGGKRRHAIARDTSVATRYSFPESRSPGSGPTDSVVWPSSSSEVRRQRQAKSDLSQPRKKRRRLRYRSVDFDSEDPVATIPDKLLKENKIRIVPRNEKPLLPQQEEEEESELRGPASKLVKPIIHRNLRRKRERQVVKRNPEFGLTERDLCNWVEADFDARDGLKPLLERRDNEYFALARSLGGTSNDASDEASVADSSIQEENPRGRFMHERREPFDKEHELMKGSVVTVSDHVIRSVPDEEEFEFKSEGILQGVRFILA